MNNDQLTCLICSRSFLTKNHLGTHIACHHRILIKEYYDKYLKKSNEGICPICQKPSIWNKRRSFYHTYCGIVCSNKDIQSQIYKKRQNCLKKYGVDNSSAKNKQTCLKNFGYEHPLMNPKFKEKYRQTCIKRFGVDHPLKNQNIQHKQYETYKNTCLRKYGVDHLSKNINTKNMIRNSYIKTCLRKYGVDHVSKNTRD